MASARVLSGLMKWLGREKWREPFDDWIERHLGPACAKAGIAPTDLGTTLGEQHASVLWGCVFEDFLTSDLDDGSNVVDDYLKRRGWNESVPNKRYMASLRSSVMSLYEVSKIVRDESFLARDLLRGGEPVRVSEKSGTHYLKPWDRIAARIVQVGPKIEMAGGLLPFGHDLSDAVLDGFADLRKEMLSEVRKIARKRSSAADTETDQSSLDTEILRHAGFLFTNIWLDDVLERTLNPKLPKMCNSEGDEIAWTTVRYPLRYDADRKALRRALTAIPGFHRENENLWNWSVPAARGGKNRPADAQTLISSFGDGSISMGHVELDGTTLVLETNSPQRAEKARAMIDPAIGTFVGKPTIETKTVEQMMESRPSGEAGPRLAGLSPDEERAIVQESIERYYRALLDEPVPMLGNLTPRKAAKTARGRQKLVDWLKVLENGIAQQEGSAAMAGYDVSWMWDELGVADFRR
jgi:hypothetical protein